MTCLAFCVLKILSLDFMTFSESISGSILACPLQMVGAGSHANQNYSPLRQNLKSRCSPKNSQAEYLSNLQGANLEAELGTKFWICLYSVQKERFTNLF